MIGGLKNAALAAGGLVAGEFVMNKLADVMPIPGNTTVAKVGLPAVAAIGGAYLGSRGGLMGKAGYGLAVGGLLHLVGSFLPQFDLDFSGGY